MEEHETPEADPEAAVQCDNCNLFVRFKATDLVQRIFQGRPYNERWCKKCIKTLDENTNYASGGSTPEGDERVGL